MLFIMTLMILRKPYFLTVVNWEQYIINRSNDDAFVINRMLGYNIVLFDHVDNNCNRVVLISYR